MSCCWLLLSWTTRSGRQQGKGLVLKKGPGTSTKGPISGGKEKAGLKNGPGSIFEEGPVSRVGGKFWGRTTGSIGGKGATSRKFGHLDNSMSVKRGWFDLMSWKFLITGTRFVPRDHKSCINFRLISLPYSILSAFNQKSFHRYNCASISAEMVAWKFRHLHTSSMASIMAIVDSSSSLF